MLLFLQDERSLLLRTSFGKAAQEQTSQEGVQTSAVLVKVFGISLFAESWEAAQRISVS